MTTFTLILKNATDQTWYFGVYQKYSNTKLHSIVWKEQGVPPGGVGQITWSDDYATAIIKLDGPEIVGGQVVAVDLGKMYEVISDRGVPSINQDSIGVSGGDDIITLKNNTDPPEDVHMGFALSKDILAVRKNVHQGAKTEFQVLPKHFVDLYTKTEVGSFVTSTVSTDPQKLVYPSGVYTMTAEATGDGESTKLTISK